MPANMCARNAASSFARLRSATLTGDPKAFDDSYAAKVSVPLHWGDDELEKIRDAKRSYYNYQHPWRRDYPEGEGTDMNGKFYRGDDEGAANALGNHMRENQWKSPWDNPPPGSKYQMGTFPDELRKPLIELNEKTRSDPKYLDEVKKVWDMLVQNRPTMPDSMKVAAAAIGLPDRSDMGQWNRLSREGQGLMDYIVQRHDAERAGRHYDIRFGDKDLGLLSWAARKGLPEPGNKHLAVQQPVHSHGYRDFEGTIPEGYGKGTVSTHDKGQALITKVTPESVHFTTAHQRHPERYTLARPKGWGNRDWLMMNTTPRDQVPYEKVHYKKIPADQVEPHLRAMQAGDTAEAKVDGASQLVQLAKGHAELLSYRTSKTTGRPIVNTERFFGGRPDIPVPRHLEGSVLKGEMYADRNGKVGTPQDVGTLSNSSIARSLQLQKERGLTLKNMLYDVQQYGKKPIDPTVTPRNERRKMLEEVAGHLPQDRFHVSEEARDPEAAAKLWEMVRSGKHPLTEEGIVYHPSVGVPSKAKLMEEHDVHLTGTFPGAGKRQATIGGFTYGHEQGKTVGRVGTGFSDDFLKEVARDPAAYTGRVARGSEPSRSCRPGHPRRRASWAYTRICHEQVCRGSPGPDPADADQAAGRLGRVAEPGLGQEAAAVDAVDAVAAPAKPAPPVVTPTAAAVKQFEDPKLPPFPTARAAPAQAKVRDVLITNRAAADRMEQSLHGLGPRTALTAASRAAGYPADPGAAPASTVELMHRIYPRTKLPHTELPQNAPGHAEYVYAPRTTTISDPLPGRLNTLRNVATSPGGAVQQAMVDNLTPNRLGILRHETEHAAPGAWRCRRRRTVRSST